MTTYQQFTAQHESWMNRLIHMITFAVSVLVLMAWSLGWWTILVSLLVLAIGGRLGHFFEGNKPTFFSRPWEIPLLIAYDGYMATETFGMMLCGFNEWEGH